MPRSSPCVMPRPPPPPLPPPPPALPPRPCPAVAAPAAEADVAAPAAEAAGAAGATIMPLAVTGKNDPPCVAIMSPFGEYVGNDPPVPMAVMAPVEMFTACRPAPPPPVAPPPPLRAKTIADPSGVHVIIDDGAPGGRETGSVQAPEVRRFMSPPAAGTIHTCVGHNVAFVRKLSFCITSNESFHFW